MLSFLGVLLLAGGAFLSEAPALFRRQRTRELAAFLALLLAATALYGAQTLGAKLPNPLMILKLLFGSFA